MSINQLVEFGLYLAGLFRCDYLELTPVSAVIGYCGVGEFELDADSIARLQNLFIRSF